VIADNASTDASPEIAARWARKESRVKHVRSEAFLADVNDSINRALTLAEPESAWCKVVLADDWLYPDCISRMLAVAAQDKSIGMVSAYQRWGDRVHLTHVPYATTVVDGRTVVARTFLHSENVTGGPTAVMYRTSIVLERDGFYEARLRHADSDAAYRTLLDHDLGFVHQVLTYARRQGDTNIDKDEQIGTAFAEDLLFVVRYGPSVLEPAVYRNIVGAHARKYGLYLVKQAVRPWLHRNQGFIAYHRDALDWLRESDAGRTPEITRLTGLGKKLLYRPSLP
jgi:glycosyltransferase involved in cell wall biosynthesis